MPGTQSSRERRRRARPRGRCGSASSASGASGACTPSCSRARCRAPRWRWSTTPPPAAREAVGAELGVPVAASVDELLALARRRRGRHLLVDRHPRRPARRRGAAPARRSFCEKPISLDLAEVDRALAAVARGRARRCRSASTAASTPPTSPCAQAVADGTIGDAAPRAHLQPRPRAAAAGVRARVGRDLPGHDDPRLRHGPLRDRQRGRRGLRVRRAARRPVVRRGRRRRHRGGHAHARQRLPDRDRQQPPGRLRLRPARRGVRRDWAWRRSENPLAHTGIVRTAQGTSAAALPHFFLDRYVPSYLREWDAFVAAVRDGATPPVTAADGRAPLVIGLAAWRSLRERRPVARRRGRRRRDAWA